MTDEELQTVRDRLEATKRARQQGFDLAQCVEAEPLILWDVPALLAEVERLRAEHAALDSELNDIVHSISDARAILHAEGNDKSTDGLLTDALLKARFAQSGLRPLLARQQTDIVAANGEPGEPYLFQDGSWATWDGAGSESQEGKQRVYIHSRTIIRTLSGEQVCAYEIEDRRGTRWQAGNGELSREEG